MQVSIKISCETAVGDASSASKNATKEAIACIVNETNVALKLLNELKGNYEACKKACEDLHSTTSK